MRKSISPDAIIGHYRVVSQIGAGGMGEVYLVECSRLHRKVALRNHRTAPRLKLYPYFVATFFADLGENDKAFAALNEAVETKDQHAAWMKVDPYMDPLRDDPRFQEVLRRVGFPE